VADAAVAGVEHFEVATAQRTEMVSITSQVQEAVTAMGRRDGVCHVFVPHTTAAVTINENADPEVAHDALQVIDRLVPFSDAAYRHLEGNSAAHVKAILVGSSEAIPVADGRLQLGTWQGVFLCEFDGPRRRRVLVC